MQTWRVFAEPVTYKSHEQMLCTVNVDVMADQAFTSSVDHTDYKRNDVGELNIVYVLAIMTCF